MTMFLRQSTASQEIPLGYFVDSTDGNTEETGLTIANTDIKLWKSGATTLANKNSGGATHISNGVYYAVLDATDTDTLGPLIIFTHVSGALTVRLECCVLSAVNYDSLIAATDNLQIDAVQMGGTALTARDIGASVLLSSGTGTGQVTLTSGRVNADVTHIATAAVSTTTAQLGVNVVNAAGTAWGSGAITAASIATDAIDADAIATDAVTEINTAVLSAISGIGTAGGAAINVDAATDNVGGGITGVTSGTTFLGTQSSGTFASTSNVNSVFHVITGTASGNTTMDIVYQFLTGAGTNVVQATWVGYVTNNGDTITVSCWRHDTGAWETMTTIAGTASSATIQTKNITLYARHRGTSTAELGKVYLRFHCTGMTTPVLGTDQIVVSYAISSRGTYSDGAVWLNTAASNTNTQSYVDGLPENPVSTIAAAITISDNLNLKRIRIANGSSITFAASMANRSLVGKNWTCALGGQSIDGVYIEGAEVSGTGTCTTQAEFSDCHINAGTTVGPSLFSRCGFAGTSGSKVTAGSAGEFLLVDCYSEVAGSGTPHFSFPGACGVNIRRWSGGSNIALDNTGTALTMEVVTGGGQTIDCGGADIEIRGICRAITLTGITSNTTAQINAVTGPISLAGADGTVNIYGVCGVVTDSRAGTPTLSNKAVSQATINTEVDTAFADYDPPTNAEFEARSLVAANYATSANQTTIIGYIDTEVAAIKAKTDNLPAAPAATGDIPTAGAIADAVWDESIAGHLSGGSTGAALNGAGSAGDPWTTTVPGAYGAGTAGYLLGTNLDATVSSRLASASYSAAPSAATVADAIWDEARSGHTSAGSFGEGVASVQGSVTGSVASVTGAVGSVTGNVGGNVVGSVGSVTGSVGSVTGNVGGNVTGSVGSVATGGITAASLATGAIDADSLAADAGTEIAAAVWASADRQLTALDEDVTAIDLNGTAVGSVSGAVGSIATGGIAAASFAAGAIDATAIAANAIGASELAADAVAEIAAAVGSPNRVTKNTALSGFTFVMQDTAGDPATGLTITAQRSIDGAALASCTNSTSEVGSGIYKIDLAAADLNGNVIMFVFSATGAKTTFIEVVTQPASA